MRKKLTTIFLALVAMLVPIAAWAQESTPEAKWGASQSELTESGTLSNAIIAAADGSVKYIQLQRDVTNDGGNYIEGGEFTLDLNGNTLSSNGSTLYIKNTGTKVTITDNSEEKSGKVVSTGNNAVLIRDGANVTISAGSYTGASTNSTLDIKESSSATISGGTFTSSSANTISNSGTLTISGGDFAPGTECVLWLFNNYQTTITGGNFNDEGQLGHIVYRSGKLYLSGYPTTSITDISVCNWESSIVVSESDIALPEGYCFYDSENQPVGTLIAGYKYTIGEGIYIPEAKWGESQSELTQSGTLADAINAAADGSVKYIQLHGNVTTDQGYKITAGEFTLDLNGYTLSSNAITLNIKNTGTKVTITDNSEGKSGKVVSTSSIPVSINDGANVTISAGCYEGSSCAVYNLSSSATISGGTFTSSSSYAIDNSGTIEISGGTFSSSISNSSTLTISGGNFSSSSTYTINNYGTLTISGGNFTSGTQCVVWLYDESQTSITGGTFTTTEGAWGTIVYQSGKLDLSAYPTTETEGTTAITDISVYNLVENPAVSASTIALPNGYSFYDGENKPVSTLKHGFKYTIGTEPETKYTITFNVNGGSGTMADTYSYDGTLVLPECTFTAPEGKIFVAWQVGESEYQPGASITFTNSITVMALWGDPEAKWGSSPTALTAIGTLSDAINAAADGSVKYIQLHGNVTTDQGYKITAGEFTLDLNGTTLSSNEYTLHISNPGTKVTITDNSEEKNGKVVSTGGGFSAVTASQGASATIGAGSYEGSSHAVIISSSSSATISGGTFSSSSSTISNSGTLTISGGTFTCSGSSTISNFSTLTISGGNFTSGTQCVVWLSGESQTTITGGSFTTTEGAYGTIVYDGGKLDLSEYPTTETEGTTAITDLSVYNFVENLAVSASTIALPNGYSFYDGENKPVSTLQNGKKYTIGTEPETKYTVTFNPNGGSGSMADAYSYGGNYLLPECTFTAPEGEFFVAWQVGEGEYQPGEMITITANITIKAVWGGPEAMWGASKDALTQRGTLSDAISAAGEDGSTVVYIQLQRDVTIDGGNNINRGEFALDLNGYTLSSNAYTLDILNTGTKVTITDNSEGKSGKVVSTGEGFSAVKASSGANVTIEAGSYESVHYTIYIRDAISSATISGGTFTSSGPETIENYGTLTISGGTFTTTEGAYGTIFYGGGKLDLSAYPTTETEGTTAITDLSVYNFVENLAVSASTIALPAGYCLYEDESNAVVTLQYENKYTIGTEPETKYTITFNVNGGSGSMAEAYSYGGKLILPECTFTAPEGKMFKAWLIDGSEYVSGCPITPTSNITAQAVWSDYIPQLVIRMHDSYGDGWDSAKINIQKDGIVIGEATIVNGYEGSAVFDYDPIGEYTFYWTQSEYPEECSFEILLGNETVYSADDCTNLAEGLFHTVEKSEDYELTVSSAGYATLCLPYNAVVPEGLTAYIATDAGEYVQLSKIESGMIAANEGVVIKGNTGTYYFAETTEEVTATEGNQLVGVTNETALTASDNAYMLTSDKNHENVAFRLLATDYTLDPYKAYLKVEEYSARTLIPAMWDDNATGIETVNGSAQDNAIYNLAGQKLTRAQKGINIVGGKLVIK